jgi:Golgi-localised syntaxin-1-binding clamp
MTFLEENQTEGSTYLTPTQRKNNEIKRLRIELNKAQEDLQDRDREIRLLR